jgi:hypothetical protein
MNTFPKKECLFIGVSHTFSLPVTTPDGLEFFDPRSESSGDEHDPRRRSTLGLRSRSHTDTEFSRAQNAFADAIHFISGQSLRSCFVSSPDGQLHDCTSDTIGWSPYPSGPANDEALKFAIQNLHILMPLNLNDEFNRVSNALRLYDLGQDSEHPDLALMSYVSSLEGLFSISNAELSFRLSLTIAKFLEQRPAAQLDLFRQIRDLYAVRSKLSHGDKICADEEKAAIQLVEHWIPFSAEIAWRCFRKLLEKKLIETFNDKRKHEAFLETLIFN